MKITLQQSEIEQAIREHVQNMGMNMPINSIDFTAGRGASGITADLDLGGAGTAPVALVQEVESNPVTSPSEESVSDGPGQDEEAVAPTAARTTNSLFGR
jgi:hypothetical protein